MLSGTPSQTQDYHNTVSMSSFAPGGGRRTSSTEVLSHGGWTTVCRGKNIRLIYSDIVTEYTEYTEFNGSVKKT